MRLKPTEGNIVLYALTAEDAEQINRRRTDGRSIAERIKQKLWPIGAQAHIGKPVNEDDKFPMVIVTITMGPNHPTRVSGQVFLAGNDTLWVEDVKGGEYPGEFVWPVQNI